MQGFYKVELNGFPRRTTKNVVFRHARAHGQAREGDQL